MYTNLTIMRHHLSPPCVDLCFRWILKEHLKTTYRAAYAQLRHDRASGCESACSCTRGWTCCWTYPRANTHQEPRHEEGEDWGSYSTRACPWDCSRWYGFFVYSRVWTCNPISYTQRPFRLTLKMLPKMARLQLKYPGPISYLNFCS